MTLEKFKNLTKGELRRYGEKIPNGPTYDKYGNMLSFKDKSGLWQEWTYDEYDKITSVRSEKLWTTWNHNNFGKSLTIEEFMILTKEQLRLYGDKIPNGSIFDDNQNEISYKKGDFWWVKTYDEKGNILSLKEHSGWWTEWTYDENYNTTSVRTEECLTKWTYDDFGNKLTLKNSFGEWEKYTYDDFRNMIIIEDSLGKSEKRTYDKNGRITSHKSRLGVYTVKNEEVSKEEYEKFIKS